MPKPRLLIPITVQFSVRYVLRTGLLEMVRDYAEPVIILAWQDAELEKELASEGIEYHILPKKQIGNEYERLLKQLTGWHLRKINSPTTVIDRRRKYFLSQEKLRRYLKIRDSIFSLLTSFPPYVRFLLQQQTKLIYSDTNLSEYVQFIDNIRPDVAFCLTPYFIEEELLIRAIAAKHIPIATAILSFDNLTTRGILPIVFEEYFLWNQHNVSELKRIYPETQDKVVKVVGAPQFDFYFNPSYIWSEEIWRKKLGLPAKKPVILFGSASRSIAPQEDQWLKALDSAIETGEIYQSPIILLRCHPNEGVERWKNIRAKLKNVFIEQPWTPGIEKPGKTNVTQEDIKKLASTLFHSRLHVNASSTMTVDGAIFDRPQIGPAYDEEGRIDRLAREIYLREHYLPITHSGGLEMVYNREELIRAVNFAFEEPLRLAAGRKKLVHEICSFTDGRCTERVNLALRGFIAKHQSISFSD